MALDRRLIRCGVFGAGCTAGVLRKNFMRVADLQSADFQPLHPQRVPIAGKITTAHYKCCAPQRPDHLACSEAGTVVTGGPVAAEAATAAALG